MKVSLSVASLVVVLLATSTTHAHAYIDPVTGTFLIQGIAAVIAGAMVAFRSMRQKVFALVSGKKRNDAANSPELHDR